MHPAVSAVSVVAHDSDVDGTVVLRKKRSAVDLTPERWRHAGIAISCRPLVLHESLLEAVHGWSRPGTRLLTKTTLGAAGVWPHATWRGSLTSIVSSRASTCRYFVDHDPLARYCLNTVYSVWAMKYKERLVYPLLGKQEIC